MTRLRWAFRAVALVVILGGAIGLWRISRPPPDPVACAHPLEASLRDADTVVFADGEVAFSSLDSALARRASAAQSAGQAYDCLILTAPADAPFARVYAVGEKAKDLGMKVRYAASE